MTRSRSSAWILGIGGLLFLSGCTIGPRFHRPPPPPVNRYTASKRLSGSRRYPGIASQTFVRGAVVGSRWWRQFKNDQLDAWVREALVHNPGLHSATAILTEAHYALRADQGIFFPQVSLGLSGERNRGSGATSGGVFSPPLFNLYNGGVSVSYYPDIFGLNRLLTNQARAQEAVAQDELDAARLTLEGDVLDTVFNWVALDQEIRAQERSISDQRVLLSLVEKSYRLGADSLLDVENQKSALATAEAALPPLETDRADESHLLAIYLGRFPAQLTHLPGHGFRGIHLPRHLPLVLPSRLIQTRPDIRAAEAQMVAANAQVGQAVARMYPLIELTGSAGVESNHWSDLFLSASRIWNVAADLTLPLFEGGTLEAEKEEAEASYRSIFANYESTVLDAFGQVANVLRALEQDSSTYGADRRALKAARRAFALVHVEYVAGAVDYLSVLTTETQLEQARIAEIRAHLQRYTDTVALYVALGGGRFPAGRHHASSVHQPVPRDTP